MAQNPNLLAMPLARDGDKTTIPKTTGSTTGDFSQQYGFQQINQLPLGAGGIAPKRNDFNGAFNLLGGVAFYAQKGWTFKYDSTQDYYKGCIVIDPSDGNKYECIADMSAGTVAPHSDSSHTHWKDANFLIKQITPAYNHRDEITTSGSYTAPVTGWYKITLKGGGAGGRGGGYDSSHSFGGGGGGEGGTTIRYVYLSAGSSISLTIGAGGSGGARSTSGVGAFGGDGGTTTVVAGGNTYTATGGVHAQGGTGDINGDAGSQSISAASSIDTSGGNGGGTGGARGDFAEGNALAGVKGGGGAGGGGYKNSSLAKVGGAGGNGYVWIEYWAN